MSGLRNTKSEFAKTKIKQDFSCLVDVVEQRIQDLDQKERHWASLEAIMEEHAEKAAEKITLDIGGQKFATTKTTLLAHKGSFFDAMLSSGRWKPDAKGRYFIDRNPELFPVILDYLRTGKVNLKRYMYDVTDDLRAELDFYLITIPELNEQSVYLTSKVHLKKILEWINKKNVVRIYSAIKDGFGATAFHSKCDAMGPTVVVAHTTQGHVFGGYTTASWNSTGKYNNAPGSFLFTLSNPFGLPPTTYPLNPGHEPYSMFCASTSGPTFGSCSRNLQRSNLGTSDIMIFPQNNPRGCSIHFPRSYADTTGQGVYVFTGSNTASLSEVEVFLVS